MMALPSQECISDHIKYFLQEDTLQMVQGVLYLHTCIYIVCIITLVRVLQNLQSLSPNYKILRTFKIVMFSYIFPSDVRYTVHYFL